MLQQIDTVIFHWINTGLSNSFFDTVMPVIREKSTWIPLYLFMVAYFIYTYRKAGLIMVLFAIVTVGTADLVSNYGFKKTVKRLRPCKTELTMPVIKRVPCGSGYSFTSNHAANHFALATFIGLLLGYRKKVALYVLLTWAFFIAFAQVYVGLHYPFDILGGGLLGAGIGYLYFTAYKKWLQKPAGHLPQV